MVCLLMQCGCGWDRRRAGPCWIVMLCRQSVLRTTRPPVLPEWRTGLPSWRRCAERRLCAPSYRRAPCVRRWRGLRDALVVSDVARDQHEHMLVAIGQGAEADDLAPVVDTASEPQTQIRGSHERIEVD